MALVLAALKVRVPRGHSLCELRKLLIWQVEVGKTELKLELSVDAEDTVFVDSKLADCKIPVGVFSRSVDCQFTSSLDSFWVVASKLDAAVVLLTLPDVK